MRLLLAEDEEDLNKALVTVLKHNNYSVDAVFNGQDALDYLETENYDGAILDIMMPKMDGLTVLKRIREQGNSVPVILLTAKSEIDDRVAGLDCGADDYLTKPFSMKELLARIRAMTRRLASKEYQMLEMLLTNPKMVISVDQFMDRIWGYDSDTELNIVWVNISYLRKKLSTIGSRVIIKATRGLGYSLEVYK